MTPDDPIPPIYNRLARLATWLLLTGLTFLATAHIHPGSYSVAPTLPSAQHTRDNHPLTFPIMVLPPLCCLLGTFGIILLSVLRRSDNRWLSTHLLVPSLMASLASLALVFYLVYKDGLAMWMLMETITAILAGAYSAVFIVASVVARRKYRRAAEGQDGETELEAGRGAPQIPEVEGVTSLKDELLPSSREVS